MTSEGTMDLWFCSCLVNGRREQESEEKESWSPYSPLPGVQDLAVSLYLRPATVLGLLHTSLATSPCPVSRRDGHSSSDPRVVPRPAPPRVCPILPPSQPFFTVLSPALSSLLQVLRCSTGRTVLPLHTGWSSLPQ